MTIVQINTTCGIGSTGKICVNISECLTDAQIENYIISSSPSGYPLGIDCGLGDLYRKVQAVKSRISGKYGFISTFETRKIICALERIKPDIIHLHNIHGHDCNIEELFDYFRKIKAHVLWTFHDCWAFTGYCPHFSMIGCDKWKSGCFECPKYGTYSWFFDRSRELYEKKKKMIEKVDLTIITPSYWLASLVRESMFKNCSVYVIYNGIDTNIFKPTESNFRTRYGIAQNQFMILGVADIWRKSKGIDVFLRLCSKLDNDKYRIVLVGTDEKIEAQLPREIISIRRTQNQTQLAEIYSAADLFVNPTREEVLGLVNIESLACGTPVLTFRTGGSPECLDNTCGSVVDNNNVDAMEIEIKRISMEHPYLAEACIARAHHFDKQQRCLEYLKLYRQFSSE